MANYVLLERITVGAAGASSVSFNNIPQTGYTDLKLVYSTRVSGTGDRSMLLTFNGSTTGYSYRALYGTGSAAASGNASSQSNLWAGYSNSASDTNNTFSNCEVYVPNFTSTNAKSVSIDGVWETNASANIDLLSAGLWSIGTNVAITSVTFTPASGTLQQYSTFSLYALAAVGTTPTKAPKAIGGDIIQTDGTYWYHAFLSSGSFTPQTALSCDVLVVAGGGGGSENAGGGGAGGVLAFAAQPLTANTAQLVTVGAGGNGSAGGSGTAGTNGGNSIFGSLTTVLGGGVGAENSTVGGNGGSGGGGNAGGVSAGTGSQGYNGGAGGSATNNYPSGGGGGAGGNGGNASGGNTPGNGGAGVTTVTNWSGGLSSALTTLGLGVSGYIAGGGAGGYYAGSGYSDGTGGSGGGGATKVAGTPNTGSGGGGGVRGPNYASGAGGSGLVIVRYAY